MVETTNSLYTPIRFVKTEIIDVEKSMGQTGSNPSSIPGTFIQEEDEPVLKNFDHFILKSLPGGITKGNLPI